MANERVGQSSRMSSQQGQGRNLSGAVTRGYSAAERCVTDYPGSAVGLAFGAGVGLGLVVGLVVKSAVSERRRSHRRLSERIGQQVLDAMSTVLPESLTSRMRS
jgi:hypothetical protein